MASRFAEHPVGKPPGQAKLVSRQIHGPAGRGRSKIPERSKGGSSELLAVWDAPSLTFGHLQK